jgi:hypothetical protein
MICNYKLKVSIMKKATFIFIMVVNSILIKAQEQTQLSKGHFFLGGGFDLEYAKHSEGEKITSIETSPNAAFFLADKFAVGIRFNFKITLTKGSTLNGTSYILRESTYSIIPFVRYYLFSYLFSEGEIGYQRYWWNHDNVDRTKFGGFTASINLGYSLFLNEHIAIEPVVSYAYERLKNINVEPFDRKSNILDFSIKINSFF